MALIETTLLDRVELSTPVPRKSRLILFLFHVECAFHLDPNTQHHSSADNQSERTTFSTKLRDVSPSKQRFQNIPKLSDLKRAIKSTATKGGVDIDMDYLLRFPIEIWVSSGEPFVYPTGSLIAVLIPLEMVFFQLRISGKTFDLINVNSEHQLNTISKKKSIPYVL